MGELDGQVGRRSIHYDTPNYTGMNN